MPEDEKKEQENESGEGEESSLKKDSRRKSSPLQEAKDLVELMKKEKEEIREMLEENKRIMEENIISGSAEAGVEPVKKKEIDDKEYAESIMKGEIPDEGRKD